MTFSIRRPRVIAAPTVEPVSLAEARQHLRLDVYDSPAVHPDDALVGTLISAARKWAEDFIGRPIAVQTLEAALDGFPGLDVTRICDPCRRSQPTDEAIALPGLLSLLSITYLDEDSVQQVPAYQIDLFSDPPCLRPAANDSWPTVASGVANAVRIRYLAGYTLAGDSPDIDPIPAPVVAAIKLILGHLYEQRESTAPIEIKAVPMGAEALLRPYRLHTSIA